MALKNRFFGSKSGLAVAVLCIGAFVGASIGCARSPQARRDKFLAAGERQMDKKDYDRAVLEFKNAVRAMPGDAEGYYQLGMALAAAGRAQDAYYSLKKAVELNPHHPLAPLRLAQIMASARDTEVVKLGQEKLKELPGADSNPEILSALALTEVKLGETTDAIESLSKVLRQSPKELGSSILLALADLSKRDVTGAEEVLKKACDSDPSSPTPHIALGQFYRGIGKPAEALAEFQRAVQVDPKSMPAVLDLAVMQEILGHDQEAEVNFRKLSVSGEKSYKPLYAMFLIQKKRTNEAIAELERLRNADASDRAVRTDLVAAYELANRKADAERVLAQALKKDSRDTDALLQRAELLQAEGNYADAEKNFNAVLNLNPDSAELHYAKAKLDEATGQTLAERQELSEALRLNPTTLPVRLKLAEVLINSKDPRSALEVLDAAPGTQKRLLPWQTQRNWILWAMSDVVQMRKGVDAGLQVDRTPELLLQDGLLKLRSKNIQGAQASLEEALKRNPGDIRALQILNQTYEGERSTQAAVEKVKEYASRQPKSAEMQEFLGMVLLRTGKRTEARAQFLAAKAADPHFAAADFSLVQLDLLDNKVDDARKRLNAIVASGGRNARAHLWLGIIEQAAGNQSQAIEEYRRTLDTDAQNTEALNNLAYLLADYADKPDEALPYAQKARELNPNNPNYADTLGWVFYRKGLYASAIKQMETATSVRQGDAVFKYHLAMAYAKSGDAAKGQSALRAALKLNSNLPEARAAEKVLVDARAARATP